jgi:hypothetical protein
MYISYIITYITTIEETKAVETKKGVVRARRHGGSANVQAQTIH